MSFMLTLQRIVALLCIKEMRHSASKTESGSVAERQREFQLCLLAQFNPGLGKYSCVGKAEAVITFPYTFTHPHQILNVDDCWRDCPCRPIPKDSNFIVTNLGS